MKLNLLILSICTALLGLSCKKEYQPRTIEHVIVEETQLDSSSIRAILALPDSSLVFATSDGYLGMSSAGTTSKLEQVRYDTIIPHFRAIATNGEDTFVMSVGNPALLYKISQGETSLVYEERHEKVFYDAMQFADENFGVAMGDPTSTCLSILITRDGGHSWSKLPCEFLPPVADGEAAFAASNGNLKVIGDHIWIVSGGKRSRVFYSGDRGTSWSVYNTPIIEGGKMTGIYSIDFFDSEHGIIFGGDWENKALNKANKAITQDGGKTWQLVADGQEPGYRSSVRYVPDTNGQELFAVGSTGISFSNDGGRNWKKVSDQGFYTIRFVNRNVAWLAGKNKIGKLIVDTK